MAHFVEIVELFWLHKTIHECPPFEMLPRAHTHSVDVELSNTQSSRDVYD